MKLERHRLRLVVAFLLWLCAPVFATSPAPATQPLIDFAKDVQPILSENCYFCHGPDGAHRKADLRLDLLDPTEGPTSPRDGYAILVPGKPAESEMILRLTNEEESELMPPPKSNRKLTPRQIETIRLWVEQGATWGKHWSLVAPARPHQPVVKDAAWPKNAIDRFVLARLEKDGIKPSPEADKPTLLRRVTLDLTGLPPTPEEVDAFVADKTTDAYGKVVDRLLASPRYGEHMAWSWLDVARYADTNGYQNDPTRTMWPWRDWVIGAMNDNLPFDDFLAWQLAGDLIPDATQDQRLASAFNRNHPFNGEGGRIPEETRVENVMDRTETAATAFLGLTVGCARCHDHKFDPISHKEYFSFYAYFNQSSETGGFEYVNGGNVLPVMNVTSDAERRNLAFHQKAATDAADKLAGKLPEIDAAQAAWEKSLPDGEVLPPAVGDALAVAADARSEEHKQQIRDHYRARMSPEYKALSDAANAAKKTAVDFEGGLTKVMVMNDATPRDTFVLDKGAYNSPTDQKVEPGVLAVLNPLPPDAPRNRLTLAKWLVDENNPLTARVTVNRYWQQFFGTGIVKTSEDFGVQGEHPMHPELLDWLAVEFREPSVPGAIHAWDVKAMHRLIVTSAAYRQSSKVTPQAFERDPENRLISRGPRHRLPAVVIRDQALAAGGLLVEKLGGPPVKPYQPPGIWEEATFGQIKYEQDHGDALYRRGAYVFWRRIVGPTGFFDASSRSVCTVKPNLTNTPLHALTTLNDVTYVEAARALAQRAMQNCDDESPEKLIATAYRYVTGRKIGQTERGVLVAALARLKGQYADDKDAAAKLLSVGERKRDEKLDAVEHAALTGVCLAILNLDEVLNNE